MADHSELKRLAEACDNLNWRFQQENWTEYAIRDDHGYIATMRVGSPKQAGPDPDREAKAKFLGAMAPGDVLTLIAENEHLTESRNEAREERNKLGDRYDQLKAENAGLKTGFEAYEQVNAGLKAELKALRLSLETCADELEGQVIQCYHGQPVEDMHPVTCRSYDRDMACVTEARAAMGKGEQS